jgi:hypothetical protein
LLIFPHELLKISLALRSKSQPYTRTIAQLEAAQPAGMLAVFGGIKQAHDVGAGRATDKQQSWF